MDAVIIIGGTILGLVVGGLTGIFGVGGRFFLTPALMILLGVPGDIAVGTGLATIVVTSSIGLFKRRNTGTVDVKLAMVIAGGSVPGVIIGAVVLNYLKAMPTTELFNRQVDMLQFVLLSLFLVLLGSIAGYILWDYRQKSEESSEQRVGLFSGFRIPPYLNFSSLEHTHQSVFPLTALGLGVGFLTSLLGTGGGVILLPLLVYLVGQRTAKAAGTSLLLVWIASALAVLFKSQAGQINLPLLASLLAGGIVGTYFGTIVGLKLEGARIRLYFVFVVLAAMVMVAFELYRLFSGSK